MRIAIIIFLTVICFSSCLSYKKMDKIIDDYYKDNSLQDSKGEISWLLNSDYSKIENFSNSKKIKALFIPAIFYWQWHTNIYTDLNNQIVINRFYNYLISNSQSTKLPSLLGENKIEFEFIKAPGEFSYVHKGYSVFYIFGNTMSYLREIQPVELPYLLRYRITDPQNQLVREGEVKIENREATIANLYSSSKILIWAHLEEYHRQQDIAFSHLVKKLELELKN